MKRFIFRGLLVLTLGIAGLLGNPAITLADDSASGYFATGCFSGVFKSDAVTPIKNGSIVQCIYAGPDGMIDPPKANGEPGGDDVPLELALDQETFTVIGASFPSDPDEGKFFDVFKHKFTTNDIVYCRVWDSSDFGKATCYGDSELYTIKNTMVDFNIFETWETNVCSCYLIIEPKAKTVEINNKVGFTVSSNAIGKDPECVTPCYSWFASGTSGGTVITQTGIYTVTQTALYTAGSKPGIDIITVTDLCNKNSISAKITVTEQGIDTDGDGVSDAGDNCPAKPNGPMLGTCMPDSDKAGEICLNNADCDTGTCSMGQEDTDKDGVGDVCDRCPDSLFDKTIIIGSCDSAVMNRLVKDGCTMSDLIANCAFGAKKHGKFVSCVSHLTNEWKNAGLISGAEKGAIQRCAAKSIKYKKE